MKEKAVAIDKVAPTQVRLTVTSAVRRTSHRMVSPRFLADGLVFAALLIADAGRISVDRLIAARVPAWRRIAG